MRDEIHESLQHCESILPHIDVRHHAVDLVLGVAKLLSEFDDVIKEGFKFLDIGVSVADDVPYGQRYDKRKDCQKEEYNHKAEEHSCPSGQAQPEGKQINKEVSLL